MRALDQLRALENSQKTPGGVLTKPPKGASVSFVSAEAGSSANIRTSHAAANGSSNPDIERRRAKALAMLETNPGSRIAVVAESGDPAIVSIAIRGVAYGEIEIPGVSYEGLALLAMLERYGADSAETAH